MKVIVEKWGPIQRCEYDLNKSMIVTYGENNIGKSYAMQVVYLLLKKLIGYAQNRGYFLGGRVYFSTEYSKMPSDIEAVVKEFAEDEECQKKDITKEFIGLLKERMQAELIPSLHDAFQNTFGTYEDILWENPVITLILDKECEICFCMHQDSIELHMEMKPIWLKKVESDFHKSRENRTHYDIYVYHNRIDSPIQLIVDRLNRMNRKIAVKILNKVNSVYFLPASRSGIYTGMNSFGPILAQLSQNRAYIRGTIQIPSISEPISDYYLELTTIRPDSPQYHFAAIAEEIEKNVLRGEVKFDNKKKTITYTAEDTGKTMELGDVSSMVSEISPITAYLKYIVRKTPQMRGSASVIFIEEPEAHLHPKNQVALIKSFVKLIRQNVKLVMASHSNYVFNELNNLLLAKDLPIAAYSPILMKYENGKSNTYYMDMDEWGVSDENFADTAEAIYMEREAIISQLLRETEEKGEYDTNDSTTS